MDSRRRRLGFNIVRSDFRFASTAAHFGDGLMKRISTPAALAAAMSSCASVAAPGFHDAGPTLTDNGASGAWTSLYATRNPAGAEFAIAPTSTFRMGIFSS